MITEAYSPVTYVTKFYGNETHPGAHLPFNFLMITDVGRESNAHTLRDMIKSWYDNIPTGHWGNWVVSWT